MVPRVWLAAGLSALAMAVAGCSADGTPAQAARHGTTVPTPDLCTAIKRATVRTALHSKTVRCATSGGAAGYSARFSGVAALTGRHPATLTVAYEPRYDAKTGLDRWETLGRARGDRVSLFGVGQAAVFEANAAPRPQLVTVQGDLIVAVTLRVSGAAVPQDRLPDHLLEIGRQAVAAAS
ncbi:MAG TPA: hypothetical protein VH912_21315 [Streptosporangiaceae bacterium]|jgi:hypothetical protein